MLDDQTIQRVIETYTHHPINAEALFERLARDNVNLTQCNEQHLCRDPLTGITDLNHAGGADAVVQIGRRFSLQAGMRVLDIGSGLGGTLRILHQQFGVRGLGVDITPRRCEDAQRLTQLVGQAGQIEFRCGDFLTMDLPLDHFDLVIGQEAVFHFPDRKAVFCRCRDLLKTTGGMHLQDACLMQDRHDRLTRNRISALNEIWNGALAPLNHWRRDLQIAGFSHIDAEEITTIAADQFQQKVDATTGARPDTTLYRERQAWRNALQLIDAGHLGFYRLWVTHK